MRVLVLTVAGLLLAACGQSGKLVMPAGNGVSPLTKQAYVMGRPVTWSTADSVSTRSA